VAFCLKNQLWAVGEEASCPFKHHSRASLHQLLQPVSESVVHQISRLVDGGNYCSACRHYRDSLAVGSCSKVCTRACLSSNSAVESNVYETLAPELTADPQTDTEVEETSDSGYDSAQSYQPVQNNCASVSSSQSSASTDTDSRFHLNRSDMASSTRSTGVSGLSHACQKQCSCSILPSEPDDGVCDVQQCIVGADCDTVTDKLLAPVDFYTRFAL